MTAITYVSEGCTMSARVHKAALALAAASAIVLTGCTASGWESQVPPAAGAQNEVSITQDNGAVAKEKARNVLFVVDDEGKGVLAGTVTSVNGTKVQGVHFAAEKSDGSIGEPASLPFTADVAPHGAVRFQDEPVTVENKDLTPGRTAQVVIQLSTGTIDLHVPVYSNTHPDFEELWNKAEG